jgi:sec-independent protein translocase protein TatA
MNSLFVLFLNLGGGEIVMILFVILLMFGGKGIPNIAKALGKGIREFKDATNGIQKDIQQSTGGITNTIQEHIQEVKKEVDGFSDSNK